jgi:hypothetical protein
VLDLRACRTPFGQASAQFLNGYRISFHERRVRRTAR